MGTRWLMVALWLVTLGAAGCTSEDIFHDTHWKTACDVDANTPGCEQRDGGADSDDDSRGTGANGNQGTDGR